LRSTWLDALRETAAAYATWLRAQDEMRERQRLSELADLRLRSGRAQAAAGLADGSAVAELDVAALTIELERVDREQARRQSLVQLARALGGGWDAEVAQ
jgi:outer membrane protein TolC